MLDENNLFRDVFSEEAVIGLASAIKREWKPFKKEPFISDINSRLAPLGFGARSALIAETLGKYLPADFEQAARVLISALPPEPETESLTGFNGFIIMPQCDFIAKYGIDHPDAALNALYEMTKRFTAEGQIRAFIRKYPEKTMRFLRGLTKDPSPFARRLSSEGTRPRLPLGSRLQEFVKNPAPVLEILDLLKEDPNEMVRRSVANNLNDIAKDNPEVVVATLAKWKKIKNPGTQRLVKHAARTLLKQGNKQALALLGFTPSPEIAVKNFGLGAAQIYIGEEISFSIELASRAQHEQRLMIDYIVHFRKANGKTAPKVFKWAVKTLAKGGSLTLSKKQSFRPISTRVYYPGEHSVEVVVNGDRVTKEARFLLLPLKTGKNRRIS